MRWTKKLLRTRASNKKGKNEFLLKFLPRMKSCEEQEKEQEQQKQQKQRRLFWLRAILKEILEPILWCKNADFYVGRKILRE